jgi:hypothetical protein
VDLLTHIQACNIFCLIFQHFFAIVYRISLVPSSCIQECGFCNVKSRTALNLKTQPLKKYSFLPNKLSTQEYKNLAQKLTYGARSCENRSKSTTYTFSFSLLTALVLKNTLQMQMHFFKDMYILKAPRFSQFS